MDDVLAGEPVFEVLFQPGSRQAVEKCQYHREHRAGANPGQRQWAKCCDLSIADDGWQRPGAGRSRNGNGCRSFQPTTSRTGSTNSYTGFLSPSQLFEADAVADSHEVIRSDRCWFDAEGMQVTQYEATSADGEKIPYFVVMPAGFEADGTTPTLLGAYGGFEVARTPFYSGIIGNSWLSRGGVYVLANIRGGGEFGPRWHQAALKEKRQRAF